MKKLLADYLNIKEEDIINYESYNKNHDLEAPSEDDYYIKGYIYPPIWNVFTNDGQKQVDLEDLLTFIYGKYKN